MAEEFRPKSLDYDREFNWEVFFSLYHFFLNLYIIIYAVFDALLSPDPPNTPNAATSDGVDICQFRKCEDVEVLTLLNGVFIAGY